MATGWVGSDDRFSQVTMPRILFIPDQHSDYRMWSDIPNRIRERAEAVHFDQHEKIPWAADSGDVLAAAYRLASDGSFDVVTTSGGSARFGFAIAEAGLAKGLVLFRPALDSIPDDVLFDFSSLEETLEPYLPMSDVVRDPGADVARFRDVFRQVILDAAVPDLPPDQLELALAMHGDHADEFFTYLRKLAAATDSGVSQPDPPWIQHPWIDRLEDLDVPVTAAVTARGIEAGNAIARRARDAEIVVVSHGWTGLAPVADRAQAAEILLKMLDRVT
jgi:hypothetical protein